MLDLIVDGMKIDNFVYKRPELETNGKESKWLPLRLISMATWEGAKKITLACGNERFVLHDARVVITDAPGSLKSAEIVFTKAERSEVKAQL